MTFKILTRTADGTSSDGDPEFADDFGEALDRVRDILETIMPGQRVEVTSDANRVLVILCEVKGGETA